jgi:hypothetical protein
MPDYVIAVLVVQKPARRRSFVLRPSLPLADQLGIGIEDGANSFDADLFWRRPASVNQAVRGCCFFAERPR